MTKPITDLKCPECGFVHEPNGMTRHTTKPTVSQVLSEAFGSDFSGATQSQRLLLLQAVAFSLRNGGSWYINLWAIKDGCQIPENIDICGKLATNEGLKLLATLNVAIQEGYSVMVANKRGL